MYSQFQVFEKQFLELFATLNCTMSQRKNPQDTQTQKWGFTINGMTAEDAFFKNLEELTLVSADDEPAPVKWVIASHEIAPTTGMPHCQGFMWTRKPIRTLGAKKLVLGVLPEDTAFEPHMYKCDRTMVEQYNYVAGLVEKKGNAMNPTFVEYGERPPFHANNGVREKEEWAEAVELAKEGRIWEIDAHKLTSHLTAYKQIAVDFSATRPLKKLDDVCGEWRWGEAGSGKSVYCFEKYPNAYRKNPNKWWCGYHARTDEDQYEAIIEDVEPSHGSHMGWFLKIWADVFPFNAEEKGSSKHVRPTKIIVTSQYHPNDIFQDSETRDAILRRFKVFQHCRSGNHRWQQYEERTGTLEWMDAASRGAFHTGTVATFQPTPLHRVEPVARETLMGAPRLVRQNAMSPPVPDEVPVTGRVCPPAPKRPGTPYPSPVEEEQEDEEDEAVLRRHYPNAKIQRLGDGGFVLEHPTVAHPLTQYQFECSCPQTPEASVNDVPPTPPATPPTQVLDVSMHQEIGTVEPTGVPAMDGSAERPFVIE